MQNYLEKTVDTKGDMIRRNVEIALDVGYKHQAYVRIKTAIEQQKLPP